ncbi:MAG: flagellar basal body rod protein FlgB [Pseudobdellovibrionaceae bacterium]|nr:flagellar basal body rod protein FlgB [Bdellovibrionales bacterium]USN47281.1 MAG: flagellar basal body rod protein FlgB [Pseudobdellovibrionaceae bacterium]
MSLFDKTTNSLGAATNMRLLRQNVITGNIANAETPGYKAKKLDFEAALSRAIDQEGFAKMNTEHADHFPVGRGAISRLKADVYDNPEINVTNDGNTVDLETEMAKLSENTILYKAAIQLMNKKLATMRYAATEGTR